MKKRRRLLKESRKQELRRMQKYFDKVINHDAECVSIYEMQRDIKRMASRKLLNRYEHCKNPRTFKKLRSRIYFGK